MQVVGVFTCQASTSTPEVGGCMSSGPFAEYKKETEYIVFKGWTSLTKMGH